MHGRRQNNNFQFTSGNQGGFTLLEILVVPAVLGFLIAMIDPRFGGIVSESQTTVTQQNLTDMVSYITVNLQNFGKYPSGVVNLVSVDSCGTYYRPMVSDQDPYNGVEVLSHALNERQRLCIHYLNAAEEAELYSLGGVYVYNYNSPYDRDVPSHSSYMGKITVTEAAAGMAVLMTGGGDSDGDGTIESDEVDTAETDRSHPDELFRILLGLGPETTLITNDVVQNAATYPEGGAGPLNYAWEYYNLLLPRLLATEHRLSNDDPLADGGDVTAYAVNGEAGTVELAVARKRTVNVYDRQPEAFFTVMDAEGATRPNGETVDWGIDFEGDGAID